MDALKSKVFSELVSLTHDCMGTKLQPLAAILPELGLLVASENREGLRQVAAFAAAITQDTKWHVDVPQGKNIGLA